MIWKWIQSLDRLLRGEYTRLPVLQAGNFNVPIFGFIVMIDALGMIYGLCMGLFALTPGGSGHAMQLLATMLKVPALFLLTLLVTFPSLYVSNSDYSNAVLFNGVMFAIASCSAQVVLRRSYRTFIVRHRGHRLLMRVWLAIYIFVGIQMSWVLRPFVGDPALPTRFLRTHAMSNAYVAVARMIVEKLR